MRLEAVDQVDVGLVGAFLADTDAASTALADCTEPRHTKLSADAKHLVLVRGGSMLLLPLGTADGHSVRLLTPAQTGDVVCSTCWLVTSRQQNLILVGYASGCLAIFSSSSELLWSAHVHDSPLVQIISGGEIQLLCLFKSGIIACAPSIELLLQQGGGDSSGLSARALWTYQLGSESPGVHALTCCGTLPSLPLDLVVEACVQAVPTPRNLVLVTAHASELQLHLLQPPPTTSAPERFTDMIAARDGRRLIARGLGALTSALLGRELQREPNEVSETSPRESLADEQLSAPHRPSRHTERTSHVATKLGATSFVRALSDTPRGFLSLALEPRRHRWLAATDTLGRVLLLEPKSLVCVRLFKGYRDAQCAWAETSVALSHSHPRGRDGARSSSSSSSSIGVGSEDGGGDDRSGRQSTGDATLLVLYAPRRGLLEIWKAPHGGRVFGCNVGVGCVLLAPVAMVRGGGEAGGAGAGGDGDVRVCNLCLLVQRTGVIFAVRS